MYATFLGLSVEVLCNLMWQICCISVTLFVFKTIVFLFTTCVCRWGAVHAARTRGDFHGGHGMVREKDSFMTSWALGV